MDLNAQRQKAEAFRRMHDRSRILVLVNVWDAMSARAVEEAGGPRDRHQQRHAGAFDWLRRRRVRAAR